MEAKNTRALRTRWTGEQGLLLCLSAKSPRTNTDQPETTGKHVLLSPITDTISPKPDSTEHWEFQRRKEDKVLPIFLPLELHTHLHVALEEVQLNCSQTSQG